jgi:hypothetical protein
MDAKAGAPEGSRNDRVGYSLAECAISKQHRGRPVRSQHSEAVAPITSPTKLSIARHTAECLPVTAASGHAAPLVYLLHAVRHAKSGRLNDPEVTIQLLKLNAVVGVIGKFVGKNDNLATVGITCALCDSTVDDSFAPGIGKRLDGWANTSRVPLDLTESQKADLVEFLKTL